MNKKAIVIGSGIAGIAASIRLACKGYEVVVLEKNAYPGGKLSEIQLGEYRFDAGPSLLTMPHLVEELFLLAGKDPKEYFDYHTNSTTCHYFWEDGTFFRGFANTSMLKKEIENVFKTSPIPFLKKLEKAEKIHNYTSSVFLEQSLHDFKNFFNVKTLRALSRSHQMDLQRSLHDANVRDVQHPKLVQLFDRYATYNGSNPYKTPGIMGVIPHFEWNVGTFFPKKGMVDITNSLVKMAEELGIEFHYNTFVEEIIIQKNQVIGVKIQNGIIEASKVVTNMDIYYTYEKLLPLQSKPKRILKQERSSSALIFYWGIKEKFQNLDLHNIFFSENYQKEFQEIFQEKTIGDDPTVYIHISTKLNPEDAPDYGESWFVMVNAPCNIGQDWDHLIAKTREKVLEKLSRILKRNIESLIEEEDSLDPRSIDFKTASYQGSLYGTSSNNPFAAFLRHPNFSSKIKGLYFVGGSTHPGGGIPLCLLSAKIATSYVEEVAR
ncbi:MAG: 1-hydroxycarotenoid 3,4-desaturase CrtD [Flavobacterium sp.]